MTVSRARFNEAYLAGDWVAAVNLGKGLVASGDYGDPSGQVPIRLAEAAFRLGQRYEAVWHADLARQVVERGTPLEAAVMCNAAYYYRVHGAPGRAIEVGNLFLEHAGTSSGNGYALRGMVLVHMAAAYEALQDLDNAITHYSEAIQSSQSLGNPALAAMATVDLAHAELMRARENSVEKCRAILEDVRQDQLDQRGLFAFYAVRGLLAEQMGKPTEAEEHATEALRLADAIDEPLVHERGVLVLLRSRLAIHRGDRATGILFALDAAVNFESTNDLELLGKCEELLRSTISGLRAGR